MSTTIERIQEIFEKAEIKFDLESGGSLLRTIWVRDGAPVTLLVFLLEEGDLVQLRAPVLLHAQDDANKPLLFRAMLQMAYEMRLVQFEYDPGDGAFFHHALLKKRIGRRYKSNSKRLSTISANEGRSIGDSL